MSFVTDKTGRMRKRGDVSGGLGNEGRRVLAARLGSGGLEFETELKSEFETELGTELGRELDGSSYEVLHHEGRCGVDGSCRLIQDGAEAGCLNGDEDGDEDEDEDGRGDESKSTVFMSNSRPNKGLDDSGTEADDEGRMGSALMRRNLQKDRRGERESRRRELAADGDNGDGHATEQRRGPRNMDGEFLRIVIEAGILAGVFVLAYTSSPISEEKFLRQKVSLICHGWVIAFLLVFYVLRIIFSWVSSYSYDFHRQWCSFKDTLPSFDSASALYPVFLPVIVAVLLLSSFEEPFIANCVLGLSAFPVHLMPLILFQSSFLVPFSYNHEMGHWLLSVIPLIVLQHLESGITSYSFVAAPPFSMDARSQIENLALLYPLHQSLLSILHHLTSSSLLQAERQLLSISLINLYIFSEIPPTIILKAVIWINGLGLLLTCRPVIKMSLFSSRIPKWRFYQKHYEVRDSRGLFSSIKELFQRTAGHEKRKSSITYYTKSDADEDEEYNYSDQVDQRSGKLRTVGNGDYMLPYTDAKSAADSVNILGYHVPFEADDAEVSSSSKQCHDKRSSSNDRSEWRILLKIFKLNKVLHAIYVYIMLVVIILWPFRSYISRQALDGHEAIGWIIGYLFGDIHFLRDWIEYSLNSWIPVSMASFATSLLPGLEQFRSNNLIRPGNLRLLFICYWLIILTFGLRLVLKLPSTVAVDTRRKVFHGMMVLILVPTAPFDPAFISLALSVVLALFLLLELLRVSGLPPLSKPLTAFLAPYVDGRDVAGPIVISHIFLLLGCSIPVWLSLAGTATPLPSHTASTIAGGEPPADPLCQGWNLGPCFSAKDTGTDMLSGVVCVGLGDAAASLIGRRYGRTKWPWSGGSKSLEGSAAFATALFTGLLFVKIWLYALSWGIQFEGERLSWLWLRLTIVVIAKMMATSCIASLLEAVLTGGNDNIVVPVVLWATFRGFGL